MGTTLNIKKRNHVRGIASLGATILLGAVIIEIALAIALLVYFLNFSNLGIRLSAEALKAAESGVAEGFIRILRNDYQSGVPTLTVGGASVQISICRANSCSPVIPDNKLKITSKGAIFGKSRTLTAVVQVDPLTSLMKIESIKE